MKVIVGKDKNYKVYPSTKCCFVKTSICVGCRDGKSKDELEGKLFETGIPEGTVTWISLDMSSMDSVKVFAEKVIEKNIPISILINNGKVTS